MDESITDMSRQTTLRTQLAVRFALLALLISTLLGGTLYFYFRTQIRQQLRQHLRDVVSLTAARISGEEHTLIQPGDNRDNANYRSLMDSIQSIDITGIEIRLCLHHAPQRCQ